MPYAVGCRGCGGPCEGPRCESCRKLRREQEAARRKERRATGRCLVCGAAVARSKLSGGAKRIREAAAYCGEHLKYYVDRRRAAKVGT